MIAGIFHLLPLLLVSCLPDRVSQSYRLEHRGDWVMWPVVVQNGPSRCPSLVLAHTRRRAFKATDADDTFSNMLSEDISQRACTERGILMWVIVSGGYDDKDENENHLFVFRALSGSLTLLHWTPQQKYVPLLHVTVITQLSYKPLLSHPAKCVQSLISQSGAQAKPIFFMHFRCVAWLHAHILIRYQTNFRGTDSDPLITLRCSLLCSLYLHGTSKIAVMIEKSSMLISLCTPLGNEKKTH